MKEYSTDTNRAAAMRDHIPEAMNEIAVELTSEQLEKLVLYDAMLIHANGFSRLTALINPIDVAKKHFADSALALSLGLIGDNSKLIDIGTGAGFPGVVLKILKPDIKLTLLDSLKKRCEFLELCCSELDISADIIDERAEIAARDPENKDAYDIATSRAVASAAVLCEWSLPFVKIGGKFLAYKGKDVEEEFGLAKKSIETLGGKFAGFEEVECSWGLRTIAIIEKERRTPKGYPRRPGDAKRFPIV